MFRAMFSPTIRSTLLYLQYLVVFTQVVAGWFLGWVENQPRHQPVANCVNTTRYCKYSQVLLMMGDNIARNM
jgi:predicted small integral membrane protein